ncbi:MAG: 3-hydroxyacyl-ACP dehydratase FabZ [Gammaproteobacteria bacterium]|nr:3-hydroxyacyl-ACP dehydratase FabZ [Gammaproteobacteria bacterium]
MITGIDINEIKNYLPQRYPFLLIDRVLECEPGKSAHALKNVSCNEDFFNGHFPQKPIMPGVLQVEALAQCAGMLAFFTLDTKPNSDNWFYFAGINYARFKRVVIPGDQLHLYVEIVKTRRDIWIFSCKATVEGKIACEAELMIAKGGL